MGRAVPLRELLVGFSCGAGGNGEKGCVCLLLGVIVDNTDLCPGWWPQGRAQSGQSCWSSLGGGLLRREPLTQVSYR